MKPTAETTTFRTRDLGEAAALCALEYELIELEATSKDYPSQRTFVFESVHPYQEEGAEGAARIASRYRNRDLQVDAYSYFLAMRELKSKIYGTSE